MLTAVDARARVQVRPATDGRWQIHAPDVDVNTLTLDADGTLSASLPADTRRALRVFDAVRATLAAGVLLPAQRLDIDTTGFATKAGKLGIGASAAVASALTGALTRACNQQMPHTALLQKAMQAHRRAQNGEGSGADVATSIMGGVVAFAHGIAPQTRQWPAGLYALAVPTGGGTDTPTLVGATRRLAQSDPSTHERCIQPLTRLAQDGAAAVTRADAAAVLAIADAYFDGLAALGEAANAPIVTKTHHQLRRIAAEAGAVFKPTGAGGGDLGLVVADSEAAIAASAAALEQAGYPPVSLGFGAAGLQVESLD